MSKYCHNSFTEFYNFYYISFIQVRTTLQHPTQFHVDALRQKNVDQYLDTSPSNHFAGTSSSPNFQSGTSPCGYQGSSPRQFNGAGFTNVSSADMNYEASAVYRQAQNLLNTNPGRDPLLNSNYQTVCVVYNCTYALDLECAQLRINVTHWASMGKTGLMGMDEHE